MFATFFKDYSADVIIDGSEIQKDYFMKMDSKGDFSIYKDLEANWYIVNNNYDYAIKFQLDYERKQKLDDFEELLATRADYSKSTEEIMDCIRKEKEEFTKYLNEQYLYDFDNLTVKTNDIGIPLVIENGRVLFDLADYIHEYHNYVFYTPKKARVEIVRDGLAFNEIS